MVWKPFPSGSSHGFCQTRMRSVWYDCRPTISIAISPPAAITARWNRFAPATKNIVNAVSVMTPVVPRSGSLKTRAMTGATMIRNGIVPPQKPRMPPPRLANQWAR